MLPAIADPDSALKLVKFGFGGDRLFLVYCIVMYLLPNCEKKLPEKPTNFVDYFFFSSVIINFLDLDPRTKISESTLNLKLLVYNLY